MYSKLLVFLLVPSLSFAASSKCRISPQIAYEKIMLNLLKQEKDGSFVEQEKWLRVLMSNSSKESTIHIANLGNIYLGESVGEILSEVITRRGKSIVPFLKENDCKKNIDDFCKNQKSGCVEVIRCSDEARVENLLKMINEKKIFQSEDKPLKKVSDKELCSFAKTI